MIPISPLLSRFWPHILAVVAVVAAVWYFSHARYTAGYEAATAAMQEELNRERELRKAVDWKVRQDYETRIADLNATVARERRGKSIRCVLGDSSEVRAGRDPGGSAGGAAAGSAVRASEDLRSELVRVGEASERMRQKLLAIKARQDRLREANP
jgi:hypothetical protein